MTAKVVRLLLLLAGAGAATGTAGCKGALDPAALSATGHWEVRFGLAGSESEFVLDLQEGQGGVVSGTWSDPSRFYRNRISGVRSGVDLTLVGDSPNIFAARFVLRFAAPTRLEGQFHFGLDRFDVTVVRRRATPDGE